MADSPVNEPEAIQVVILPAFYPILTAWLEQNGWHLFPIPYRGDDLPTFGVGVTLPHPDDLKFLRKFGNEDDEGAYEPDDPKSPGYHDRLVDLAD